MTRAINSSMWTCPLCQSPLLPLAAHWQCEANHCYDVAKSGYVNLLLVNQKSSSDPGDNKEMITARRAFLGSGHYLPLVELLSKLIQKHSKLANLSLYDAGCGEGYYLENLASSLQRHGVVVSGSGSDISRSAIEKAAKKTQSHQFVIASNFNIPVADNSQNALLQVFAPGSAEEVYRLLTDQGIWLRVSPGAEHLSQLKKALYQTPEEHKPETELPVGFIELEKNRLSFDVHLSDNQSRKQLLMMTPFYWRVEEGKMDSVLKNMSKLTADFSIRVLQKAT